MNISGTANALRLLYNPSLFIPQVVISNFNQLPIPIPNKPGCSEKVKFVVLDKDNCFAEPHTNHVWHEYNDTWKQLKEHYGAKNLLIVSNTAGSQDDVANNEARVLEQNTGVKVFMHSQKKPGCRTELWDYLTSQSIVQSPAEIAVVGDRLMTDVLMANLMGAQSIWIKDGVIPNKSVFSQFEHSFYKYYYRK